MIKGEAAGTIALAIGVFLRSLLLIGYARLEELRVEETAGAGGGRQASGAEKGRPEFRAAGFFLQMPSN